MPEAQPPDQLTHEPVDQLPHLRRGRETRAMRVQAPEKVGRGRDAVTHPSVPGEYRWYASPRGQHGVGMDR